MRQLRPSRADGLPLAVISPVINTTLVSASLFAGFCQGRLTLTTATPVTSADVTAATTIYFTPYKGNLLALYDGSTKWTVYPFTEISLALGTLTNALPYDVFVYDNAGTPTLEFLAWTNATARATALTTQNGIYVKTGDTTRRYLGTFYTTSTTTTEDSMAKRFLWNYYNRLKRVMQILESTDTWVYNSATVRQVRASAANQFDFVVGVAEVVVFGELIGVARHATAVAVAFSTGFGDDSTTAFSGTLGRQSFQVANQNIQNTATICKFPAIGRHFLAWLESGGGGASDTTMVGDEGGGSTTEQTGLMGWIEG